MPVPSNVKNMSVCNASLQLKLRCCINTHPLRKKQINNALVLIAGHAPQAKTCGHRMANARKTCKPVPKSQNIAKPVTNTFHFRILRVVQGLKLNSENDWLNMVEPKLHIPKKCATSIYTCAYEGSHNIDLIRHSAHFALSCPIAHGPLLRQSGMSYCNLVYTNPMQP